MKELTMCQLAIHSLMSGQFKKCEMLIGSGLLICIPYEFVASNYRIQDIFVLIDHRTIKIVIRN